MKNPGMGFFNWVSYDFFGTTVGNKLFGGKRGAKNYAGPKTFTIEPLYAAAFTFP
jgi:hypothetical protein